MVKEQRQSYSDVAEIWVDGTKHSEVQVRLTGYVDVIEIKTFGGVTHHDGVTSWDGYVDGMSQHEQLELFGKQLELRLSNGQTGRAVLADNTGFLRGMRDTQF